MELVNDIEKVKERFNAFWNKEVTDRPLASIVYPSGKKVENMKPESLEQKWLDVDYRQKELLNYIDSYSYYAEAFPHYCLNLGPSILANFAGGDFVLDENTIWYDRNPLIKDISNRKKLSFDENSFMWKKLVELSEKIYKYAGTKYFVGNTDIGGTLDIAASLLGTEEFLCNLYDEPDAIIELVLEIDEIWLEAFGKFKNINDKYQKGYSTWLPLWCEKEWYPIQCDVSVNFSADMFEKFAKESLAKQAKGIDGYAVYHLDGYQQHIHLDHILDIPEIHTIEWVPMTKNGWLDHYNEQYFSMYKKIQDKGKNLIMRYVEPKYIEKLFEVISPKGVFISTVVDGLDSAKEVEKILYRTALIKK